MPPAAVGELARGSGRRARSTRPSPPARGGASSGRCRAARKHEVVEVVLARGTRRRNPSRGRACPGARASGGSRPPARSRARRRTAPPARRPRAGSSRPARRAASSPAAPSSWRVRPRKIRNGVQAVRTPASSRRSNKVGVRAAQVIEVHVVDDVVDRAQHAERAHRLAGGPVVDVAPLAAVVPVDRGHAVRVERRAGRDRGRRGRRDGREDAHAVRDVAYRAAGSRRTSAPGPRSTARSSIAGLSASTTTRTSLVIFTGGCASPSYFCPARRRCTSEHPERRTRVRRRTTGETSTASAASASAATSANSRRAMRPLPRPRARAASLARPPEERPRRDEAERRADRPAASPGRRA